MTRIVALELEDIRFPTSATLDGSDAMNPDPDYSAAYVRVVTDEEDGPSGHAFAFTIGRGNDVQVTAIESVGRRLVGRDVESLTGDMGATWRELASDSQLRWLGPEKGIAHMALGAVVNALWDLKAKRAGEPLWRLLSRMSPEEIVGLVDFSYLGNALTREEAVAILEDALPGRGARERVLLEEGYPAYTTGPGWLGYSDEKLERLCTEAIDAGFRQIKLKIGADLSDDKRRLGIARRVCGADFPIAVDANQRWEVPEAIHWIRELAPLGLAWVEEPTSPDDILGLAEIAEAVAPVRIATGEHVHNRVMFKQLLQARALSVLQIDAARVGGVNENIAILLLAAKFGVPVCPHAGGVGLCEAVQHFSMFDFVAVSGSREGRWIEYVDHLHEHMADPVAIRDGRYLAPERPGIGMEILAASRREFAWSARV